MSTSPTKKHENTWVWCINLHVLGFKIWVKSQTSHQLHTPTYPWDPMVNLMAENSYVLPQDHGGCGKNTPTFTTTILREIMRKSRKFPLQQQRQRWLLEHVKFENMGCIWTMFRSERRTHSVHPHLHIRHHTSINLQTFTWHMPVQLLWVHNSWTCGVGLMTVLIA